ncbi:hypothetical protein OY671_007782, partial [Metschnikowia pulcherrima]
ASRAREREAGVLLLMPVPEVSGGGREGAHSPIHPHVDLAVLNLDSDSFAGIDSNSRGRGRSVRDLRSIRNGSSAAFDPSGTQARSFENITSFLRERISGTSGTRASRDSRGTNESERRFAL